MEITKLAQAVFPSELFRPAEQPGQIEPGINDGNQHSETTATESKALKVDSVESDTGLGLSDPGEDLLMLDMSTVPFDLSLSVQPVPQMSGAEEWQVVDALVNYVLE